MKKKKDFNYYEQFAKAAGLAKDAVKELKNYVADFNENTSEEEKK